MSPGVRRMRTPCFSCSSFSASAFWRCHFAHQMTKVSLAIDLIISWCSGLRALPHVAVDHHFADGDVLVHARRVVVLPDVVEAQAQVLDAADPLGAVDHAALRRRDDLAAGHVDRGHAHALPDLGGHAGLAALHALEVGEVLDRALEPAEGLRARRQDRDPVHVELELLLEQLVAQVDAAAVVHPAERIDHVHAEGAAGAAGAQDRGLVLADPVARPGVRAVEHFLVGGVEHFERRHDLPRGHGRRS